MEIVSCETLTDLDARLGEIFGALAREWVGTPYFNTGRELGLGVDCVGVVLAVSWRLGLTTYDDRGYSPEDGATKLAAGLRRFCREVPPGSPLRAGDLPFMRIRGVLRHVGIISDRLTLVHAHAGAGRVVEHGFDGSKWADMTEARFRWALDTPESVRLAWGALRSRQEVF